LEHNTVNNYFVIFFLQVSNGEVSRKRGLIMCLTSIHNIHTSTGKSVGRECVCVCLSAWLS